MSSVVALLLADGRTPSGGHAHSGGLEAALAEGLTPAEIPAFMRARLRTVGRVHAALAALASAVTTLAGLLALDLEAAARTPAGALREVDRHLGLALLRTGRSLWPGDALLASYGRASSLTPRAVAGGVLSRAGGLDARSAARLSLYDDTAGVAAAAVKLVALDAARATAWVAQLTGEIETLADEAAEATVASLPSSATPLLDLRAQAHASRERRLFVS